EISWAVTKHISDSFNLLKNLSGFCFVLVSFRLSQPSLSGTTPIIEFCRNFARAVLQKIAVFLLFFPKNGKNTSLTPTIPDDFTNYSQLF
ncbi:MAG: hypothetical protein MJZ10_06145, partial [Fibrobacter sp.]|nr:hypothetical protein [Fibrobacter sp.]